MTPFRPVANDELEGAYLSVIATFRDLGIDVYNGYTGPTLFSFNLELRAKRRWLGMVRYLLQNAKGYLPHVCKQVCLRGDALSSRWHVSIRGDRIVHAADRFRKDLLQAWEEASNTPLANLPDVEGWE